MLRHTEAIKTGAGVNSFPECLRNSRAIYKAVGFQPLEHAAIQRKRERMLALAIGARL